MYDNQLRIIIESSPHEWHRILFDEYINYVYTLVYNKLRNIGTREDIEECVGDVFAKVYMSYNKNSVFEGDLKGYIATLANRTAIDTYRKLSAIYGRTVSIEESSAYEIEDKTGVEETVEKTEQRHLILDKIEELGEPDSTIMIQKYYFNRTSKDIAKIVKLTPAAVRKRCSRAVKKLREMLSETGLVI